MFMAANHRQLIRRIYGMPHGTWVAGSYEISVSKSEGPLSMWIITGVIGLIKDMLGGIGFRIPRSCY